MNEKFYKKLIDVMVFTALSDGIICEEELEVIKMTIKAFDIEYSLQIDSSLKSIDEIFCYDFIDEERLVFIDFIIHVIAADGEFNEKEREFINKVFQKFNISKEKIKNDIIRIIEIRSNLEKEWNLIKQKLF